MMPEVPSQNLPEAIAKLGQIIKPADDLKLRYGADPRLLAVLDWLITTNHLLGLLTQDHGLENGLKKLAAYEPFLVENGFPMNLLTDLLIAVRGIRDRAQILTGTRQDSESK